MDILLATANHTPFYVAAGALAAWAVLIGFIGIRSNNFPEAIGGF